MSNSSANEFTGTNSAGSVVSFHGRRADLGDVPTILALQDRAAGDMPESAFVRTRESELRGLEEEEIGLLIQTDEGNPVAFGLAVTDRQKVESLHREVMGRLGHPLNVWMIDTVFVDPAWRGYGLQRHLVGRFVDLARTEGVVSLVATVAPVNRHSLDNFLALGFTEVSRGSYYGGHERSVMARTL